MISPVNGKPLKRYVVRCWNIGADLGSDTDVEVMATSAADAELDVALGDGPEFDLYDTTEIED